MVGVFSLDAPIGGVKDSLLCTGKVAPGLTAFCTFMAGVGPYVANEYFVSWNLHDAIWQSILNLDGNGQYIPVGTSGDNLYSFGDFPTDGLFSQLVFNPGCAHPCNPAGFDFGSDCSGVPSDFLDSHSFVKNCPNVVNYIGCVLIGQGAGCGLPTMPSIGPHPTDPAKLAGPVPSITGTLTPSILSPGQSATISGTGLGIAPGLVQFMGATTGFVDATVSNWTDTQITLTVPMNATTGPVGVQMSAGTSVVVGEATVLSPANGVAKLNASLVGQAPLDGQSASVAIQTVDGVGSAVPNVSVGLSNGVGVVTGQTDTTGHVTLQMPGFGTMGLVAYSGNASTVIDVTWNSPLAMTLKLASSSRTPPTGAPITFTATLDDASGQPVGSQPVAFQLFGPSSITLSNSIVSTDSSGVATITVTNTGDGPFVVAAIADNYTATASLSIRPILPIRIATSPSSPGPSPGSRTANPSSPSSSPGPRTGNSTSSGSPGSRLPHRLVMPDTTSRTWFSAITKQANVLSPSPPRSANQPELTFTLDEVATRITTPFGRGDVPDFENWLWIGLLVVFGALIGPGCAFRRKLPIIELYRYEKLLTAPCVTAHVPIGAAPRLLSSQNRNLLQNSRNGTHLTPVASGATFRTRACT